MFDPILVTTDGSALGNLALPHAAALARAYGSELILVYAVPPVEIAAMYGETTTYGYDAQAEHQRLLEKADQILAEGLALMAYPAARSVRLESSSFHVAQAIAEEAERSGAKLLVMSTHGRSGLAHLFLGSVAEEVLRKVKVPVLLVPRPENAPVKQPSQEAHA